MNHLLVCCTHHKTGTNLMVKVMREIARTFDMQLQICRQHELRDDCDIWVDWNSLVDFGKVTVPYRGIHLIRDPRDIVVSGYFYHRRCSEKWCLKPRPRFNGLSYRDRLQTLDQGDGLMFEMEHNGWNNIRRIARWNYRNENILEIRYEQLMTGYDETFERIFAFFGFSEEETRECVNLARKHDVRKYSSQEIERMSHVHSIELQKWRKYFGRRHKDAFKELHGDLLVALGYEKDNDW